MTPPDDPTAFLAAREIYALINKEASYPPSTEAIDHFGYYAELIQELRDLHAAAQVIWARGELCDPWDDAALLWEGRRHMTGTATNYAPLDALVRQISKLPPGATQKIEYVVDWSEGGITAAQLQRMVFPPRIWVVDSILSIGATVLGGKSKSKKSWLALNCGVAVAYNGKAMGQLDVAPGRVLYLDLESNQQRMQERLQAILGNQAWPDNLHIFTKWERGPEGIARIDLFCQVFSDTRLVIVDILQNIRPQRIKGANPYDEDYEAVKALNQCAERNNVAMLILHHTRKAKADDVFDELSGTMGLTGGVAGMWVLSAVPGEKDASTLSIRGRDIINDDPIALVWDAYLCQHTAAGTAAQYAVSHERRAVLEVMEDDQEHTAKDLAETTGKSVNAVTKILVSLASINAVEKTGHGKYAIVRQNRQNRQNRNSRQSKQNDSAILPPILPTLPTPHEDMAESFQGNGVLHNTSSKDDSANSAMFSIETTPIDPIPEGLRRTTRMMLVSSVDRNQTVARNRCEEYGVDFEIARAWALELARKDKP